MQACAKSAGGQGVFELAIQTLVTINDDANKATLNDALPELLSCVLQARAAAAERPDMSKRALLRNTSGAAGSYWEHLCSEQDSLEHCAHGHPTGRAVCKRADYKAAAGLQQIDATWHGVVVQLADEALENVGVEFVEKPSWKAASGFAQQARCYALLAAVDLAFASQLELVLDAAQAGAASERLDSLLQSRDRLVQWLHGVSRPRALTGAPRCIHGARRVEREHAIL